LAFDTLIEEVKDCEEVFDITNISRQRLARR
jgi:hypothetical protein